MLISLLPLLVSSLAFSTNFPSWRKLSPPFTDPCAGVPIAKCEALFNCSWITTQDPQCYLTEYYDVTPPDFWSALPLPFTPKFFNFQAGIHLSEGTYQQFYYNTDVDTCAQLCLESAGGLLNTTTYGTPIFGEPDTSLVYVRCLSFDFFPFETHATQLPYSEANSTGICVLNDANKDVARLRNVDQGFTDAELFASSYYNDRPFSNLEGYYEIRDSRGGGIATLLDYNQNNPLGNTILVWGRSRWGSIVLSVPELPKAIKCPAPNTAPTSSSRFQVAFTPVGDDQHCTGLGTKTEAEVLCAAAGATLCPDQATVSQSRNVKLGCGYDSFGIWSAADKDVGLKYPRCCGQYQLPVNCGAYTQANIKRCLDFSLADKCIWGGSGTARQIALGFGHAMPLLREHCVAAIAAGRADCRTLLIQTWTVRDTCIWCPTTGLQNGGGAGQCRPGNNYGVCNHASYSMQKVFEVTLMNQCGVSSACMLASSMPDLGQFFFGTDAPVTVSASPTVPRPCSSIRGRIACRLTASCVWTGTYCKQGAE